MSDTIGGYAAFISWETTLKVFILVIYQLDAQHFTTSLFHASTCFEHHVLIIRKSKLYYTASGIITPISGRPVHGTATYRCDDTRGCTWCSQLVPGLNFSRWYGG